jgi:hypothetical protein
MRDYALYNEEVSKGTTVLVEEATGYIFRTHITTRVPTFQSYM